MKLFVALVMLSSLLFSWQKQIIVGCYSVENNGKRALGTMNKQMEEDLQLKDFVNEYKLRAINTVISDYTVVSINAFSSYRDLLNTMLVLKRYYPDAYVLKYPTKNIAMAENLQDIEAKAMIEEKIEVTQDAEEKAKLEQLLEEKPAVEENVVKDEPEVVEEPKEEVVAVEETKLPEPPQEEMLQKEEKTEVVEPKADEYANNNHVEEQTAQTQENILYIVLLALLALIAAGATVFKIASNTKSKKSEDDAQAH